MGNNVSRINLPAVYHIVKKRNIGNNRGLPRLDIYVSLENIPQGKSIITPAICTCNLNGSAFSDCLSGNNNCPHCTAVKFQSSSKKLKRSPLPIHTYSINHNICSAFSNFLQ